MKVSILGLSPRSHHLAPWGDDGWELWGLAWDADFLRFHRTFEIHDDFMRQKDPHHYVARLNQCRRLYMQDQYPEVPGSIRYPNELVEGLVGQAPSSSIAYAMGLAIAEGAQEIGLWGVDMKAQEEYAYQLPNMNYLIGFARGRGIKVFIHETSPLCRFDVKGYTGRYGRTTLSAPGDATPTPARAIAAACG